MTRCCACWSRCSRAKASAPSRWRKPRRAGGGGRQAGQHAPNDDHTKDIAQAFAIVRALGALDVGQAAVVCEGLALAVEAAEGTDAMVAQDRKPARQSARHAGQKTRRAGEGAEADPGPQNRSAGDRR